MRLKNLLGTVVASVSAMTGCIDVLSGDDECPHEVVIRKFDVQVASDQACDLVSTESHVRGFYISPATCRTICNDSEITRCELPLDYLDRYVAARADAGPAVPDGGSDAGVAPVCADWPDEGPITLSCEVTETRGTGHNGCPVEGRRPEGLQAAFVDGPVLGSYFARCAYLEAAAVIAFRNLGRELDALGAPASLLDAIARAQSQEIRHTALATRLAARFGASVPPVAIEPVPRRSLAQIARENVVEGLVRETFGAAVAIWRATHAGDRQVRRIFATIASDECSHAELSREIAEWLHAELAPTERATLDEVRARAIAELEREMIGEPAPALRTIAGLPSAAASRGLLAELRRRVWHAPNAA